MSETYLLVHDKADPVGIVGVEDAKAGMALVEWIMSTDDFSIEKSGDIDTVAMASRKTKGFVQWATELQREECDLSELWVSVKCGESDTTSDIAPCPIVGDVIDEITALGCYSCFGETSEITGAEVYAASRGMTPEIDAKFMKTWESYNQFILDNKTDDLSDSQPTKGNIEGGLTAIEEKVFGNIAKIGKIKYIDVDVSGILRREMNLDAAGDKLLAEMTRVCNGRNTAAKTLEYREFVITKLYRSA